MRIQFIILPGSPRALRHIEVVSASTDKPLPAAGETTAFLRSDNSRVWDCLAALQENTEYTVTIEERTYPGEAGEVVSIVHPVDLDAVLTTSPGAV